MSAHWTEAQKRMYGRVYRFIAAHPTAVTHQKTPTLSAEHWDTIAHNAAWLAAEFLEPGEVTILDNDTGEVVASTEACGRLH